MTALRLHQKIIIVLHGKGMAVEQAPEFLLMRR